jgi:3-(3-hydroxy-phenyl)propionate hydroxylase
MSTYDVAIVGAGPAGAVAANLCGVYGLSAIAFDREPGVYDLPRAVGMWDDVQRILANARVLDAFLPDTCVQVGAEFVDAGGQRILGIEMPAGFTTPNGYPVIRMFHQPGFERAVRSCLSRYEHVELRVAHEVTAIAQDHEGVSLAVRDRRSGKTADVRARWLLGCDGAASFVRKSSGIGWHSLGYDRDWLVVDVRLTGDVALSQLATQICDPARPTTLMPLPHHMHRWEFQLGDGETREEMEDPARVWALLRRWVTPADAEIVRAVVYRFHATIADTFRRGRVLLVGDAAHQTPPFLGQGMCSGVRDVDNLVWKIDHVRRGLAGDALLDTYSEERRPMAVAMVEHSVKTGKLIDAYAEMARGGPEPSAELREYAYGGRAQLPHLSTGLLAPERSQWIGRLVPQCAVAIDAATGAFDEVVGQRWAIVAARDPRGGMSAETLGFWESLGAAFVTVPEPDGPMLALLLAHEVAVVRPDRIVYGVSTSPDRLALLLGDAQSRAAAG